MEKPRSSPSSSAVAAACGICNLSNDILENIMAKLPAQSFGFAACVSRSWNLVCSLVLSRPVFASALSLHPSFPEAMKEVVGKVLSGPIRPHFAILCICPTFDLDEAHRLIAQKLGSNTPLITCKPGGVIGREALTDRFNEVMFPYYDEDDDHINNAEVYKGISLTVGYVPGLKVDIIPLSYPIEGHSIDKFVVDIRDYSAAVSGCTSPQAVFLFGDSQADMKPMLEKLDYALSERTVIAGNESCRFRWGRSNSSFTSQFQCERGHRYGAVGLVFASDKNTPKGAWKFDFHFAVGAGVTAVGPTYRVVSAKLRCREFATWLTAKREGENETLDGEQILNDLTNIDMETGEPILDYDLYIGVTKRRKYAIGSEKVKAVTSLSYHSVQQGDEQYLYVHGLDIKTGDSFRFYVTNPRFAARQCEIVSENLRKICHKDVIGSFLFSCCGRGSMFFGEPNVDSLPILNNFPSIPLAGMFCGAEIGRGPPIVAQSGPEQDPGSARACLHVYSSIYVLISCSQASCRP